MTESARSSEDLLDEILVEADAATLAHISERTMRQRRYEGLGPDYILVGRRPLYRRRAVLEWLLRQEQVAHARN